MGAPQTWMLEKRAEAMAVVHLTRRADLCVERNVFDHGPRLLVSILNADGSFSGRQFGVELEGRASGARPPRVTQPSLRREREAYRDFPFPVCAFLFMMDDDSAHFRWIVEPVVNGAARLESGSRLTFEPLTTESLDHVVAEINRWYDARA